MTAKQKFCGGRAGKCLAIALSALLAFSGVPTTALAQKDGDESSGVVGANESYDDGLAVQEETTASCPDENTASKDETLDEEGLAYSPEERDLSAREKSKSLSETDSESQADVFSADMAPEAENLGDADGLSLHAEAAKIELSDCYEYSPEMRYMFYMDGQPHQPEGISYVNPSTHDALALGTDYVLDGFVDEDGNSLDGAPSEAGDYTAVYRGIGDYVGTNEVLFSISERSLSDLYLNVGGAMSEYILVSTTLVPEASIYDQVERMTLAEGSDYRLEYRRTNGKTISLPINSAGSYEVRAIGLGSYGGTSTNWQSLTVVNPGNVPELALGKKVEGSVAKGDIKFFRFELPKSGSPFLEGTISFGEGGNRVDLPLYDQTGLCLSSSTFEGGDLSQLFSGSMGGYALKSGVYYIAIDMRDMEASSVSYSFSVKYDPSGESFPESQSEDDDSMERANDISLNKDYRGQIAVFDGGDFYRLSVPSSGKVVVRTKALAKHEWFGHYLIMGLSLYDSGGNEVWSGWNENYGTSSDWSSDAIELPAGTYYLNVGKREKGFQGNYGFRVVFTPDSMLFTDVSEKTPHSADIAWLAASGISTGWTMKDGTTQFRPMNTVIRQDMAAFLFREARLWGLVDDSWQPTGKVTFTDVTPKTPHYREIMWLAESGVSAGWTMKDGTKQFRPTNTVIRQDMAAFLRRMQALRDQPAGTLSAAAESPFTDVNARTPHYEDVLWLADSGVSAGWTMKDGTKQFRPTNTVVRQDMAAFLQRLNALG